MSLVIASIGFAQWGSLQRLTGNNAALVAAIQAPSNFSPSNPSKEYIYAGGRLVATEEPVAATLAAPTNLLFLSAYYLGWNDNSNNETGFKIERSTSGPTGPWSLIGTVTANITLYKYTEIKNGGAGWYRVRATNAAIDSAYSNVISKSGWLPAPSPPLYECKDDFSPTQNPNGAWSYGYRASAAAPFALFTNHDNPFGLVAGLSMWYTPNAYNLPALVHNGTGATQAYFGATQPTTLLNLYPGATTEKSVLRWTAPSAMTIQIAGRFEGLDNTTTDVAVVQNNTTSLFAGNINGFGNQAAFSMPNKTVAAGDTIDFQVGNGNGTVEHDSTGLLVTIIVQGTPPSTYNVVNDFSATGNPGTGVWSYGNLPVNGAFTPLANNDNSFGLPSGMHTWYQPGAWNLPVVIHNGTGVTQSYFGATHPIDLLNLYPGPSGEKSVVRWTAPRAGTAQISGRFQGLDTTTTDVAVVHNTTSIASGNINGLGNQAQFTLTRTVAAGDTIEFRVGYSGEISHDSTGLAATITLQ